MIYFFTYAVKELSALRVKEDTRRRDKLNEVIAYIKEQALSGKPLDEDKINGFKLAAPL